MGSSRGSWAPGQAVLVAEEAPEPRSREDAPTGRAGCRLQPSDAGRETSDSRPERPPRCRSEGQKVEEAGGSEAKQGIACPQWPSSGAGHTSGNKAEMHISTHSFLNKLCPSQARVAWRVLVRPSYLGFAADTGHNSWRHTSSLEMRA